MISGLFPNPDYPLSVTLQNIILFAAGFIMGMYFPYYFYKAFNLSRLKFYAYWGSVFFILLPFIVFFLIPYYITKDLESSKKLLLIVAFLYASSFLYSLNRAIREQSKEQKVLTFKNEIISVYVGAIFWIALPVISYVEVMTNAFFQPIFHFNDTSQVIEMLITNAGLLMMTIVFIRQSIRQSREEYEKLLDSETKLQEMNLQLQKSNDELLQKVKERTKELEIANEQRTNTFINLAHDIKTPLTLINNYLAECIDENSTKESLEIVRHNVQKLTKNVVNFFDSERIRKGVIIYDHNQVANFSKVLTDNVILFQMYGLKWNIEVTSTVEDNLFMKADPQSLDRIVTNIIGNAIKYTEDGGKVHVSLKSNNGKIKFSVKDTGIGIPTDLHEKIFDPSSQIESKKINSQGMGLGLFITQKIVEGLEGNIKVVSNPEVEKGTEIYIQLPEHKHVNGDQISKFKHSGKLYEEIYSVSVKDTTSNNELPTLLVVEDNIELINLIGKKFTGKYNFYIALNGNQAIDKLKMIKHLDLIVSDVMMDDGNGFELYENIILQKRFRHIPFIFITAKTEDKLHGLSLGAIDYILKPFQIEELALKIDSVLGNLSEQRRAVIESAYNSIISKNADEQSPIQLNQARFEENCIKYDLTSQEKKIIPMIAKGQTNKEIAKALSISDYTVKTHLQNIFEKVNATGKLELLSKLEVISF